MDGRNRAAQLEEEAQRLIRGQDIVGAERALGNAIDLDRKNIKCLERRAKLRFDLKRFDEAMVDIARILDISPSKKQALYLKANTLFEKKDYETAVKSLDLAIEQENKP